MNEETNDFTACQWEISMGIGLPWDSREGFLFGFLSVAPSHSLRNTTRQLLMGIGGSKMALRKALEMPCLRRV